MKGPEVDDAKAALSAVVTAAERGEPTLITKHGKPVAVIAPASDVERLYPKEPERRNLGAFLATFPGGLDLSK